MRALQAKLIVKPPPHDHELSAFSVTGEWKCVKTTSLVSCGPPGPQPPPPLSITPPPCREWPVDAVVHARTLCSSCVEPSSEREKGTFDRNTPGGGGPGRASCRRARFSRCSCRKSNPAPLPLPSTPATPPALLPVAESSAWSLSPRSGDKRCRLGGLSKRWLWSIGSPMRL